MGSRRQRRIHYLLKVVNRAEAAIGQLEKALALDPHAKGIYVSLGDLYIAVGNTNLAVKRYQQALSLDPNDAVAANNLAWTYAEHGGDLNVALSFAEKAKELQPDLTNASDTLGWIQYKKGLYSSAVPNLEQCVSKKPDSAAYRYHLGMALLANGDTQKAKQNLTSALHLNLAGVDAEQARRALQTLAP